MAGCIFVVFFGKEGGMKTEAWTGIKLLSIYRIANGTINSYSHMPKYGPSLNVSYHK